MASQVGGALRDQGRATSAFQLRIGTTVAAKGILCGRRSRRSASSIDRDFDLRTARLSVIFRFG